MEFIDQAKIYVRSGRGGDGCVSFRREKYVPKGGPDGGAGGRGGHVIFVANPQHATLRDFKYQQHYRAQHGEPGRGKQQTGKNGEDLIVEVPCGTIIRNHETKTVLADLHHPNQEITVARGGRGGRGNMFFKSSTNQAPREAEKGGTETELTLELELKLLADIAMVGHPNAGKSTLLSVISEAKPKIADYPFTTLSPQLGAVSVDTSAEGAFVVADIPGLIKHASEGKGLGIRFLKHLERSHLFWFVIELGDENNPPLEAYETLRKELAAYKETLKDRPYLVVLNKNDLNPEAETFAKLTSELTLQNTPYFLISAATKEGITPLLRASQRALTHLKQEQTEAET